MTARGHPYIMDTNLSRSIRSPLAYTRTVPSGRFITSPLTLSFTAILRMQFRNPTFCTLPDIRISIVFTKSTEFFQHLWTGASQVKMVRFL